MAAVRCERCGHDNLSHEDLGRWVQGEPQLVDERGNGYKFENTVEGVRAVKIDPPPAATRMPLRTR